MWIALVLAWILVLGALCGGFAMIIVDRTVVNKLCRSNEQSNQNAAILDCSSWSSTSKYKFQKCYSISEDVLNSGCGTNCVCYNSLYEASCPQGYPSYTCLNQIVPRLVFGILSIIFGWFGTSIMIGTTLYHLDKKEEPSAL
jgi:hypothetical protein